MKPPDCSTCPLPAAEHHQAWAAWSFDPTGTTSAWHRTYGDDVDATGALIGPGEVGLRARFLTHGQIEQWAVGLLARLGASSPPPELCETEFTAQGALVLGPDLVPPGGIVEALITDRRVTFRPGADPRAHDVYRGRRTSPNAVSITIWRPTLNAVGEVITWSEIEPLPHRIRHSPTGLNWGYGGSGPADCARSLLLHAIDSPRCPACGGTRSVVHLEDGTTRALDPYRDDSQRYLGACVGPCSCCDDGVASVPYQRFKWQVLTHFGDEWELTRAQILTWLAENAAAEDETGAGAQ